MSARSYLHAFDAAAQKWCALAQRRRAHLEDMLRCDRWQRYYAEQQFVRAVQEATQVSERWCEIAPPACDSPSS